MKMITLLTFLFSSLVQANILKKPTVLEEFTNRCNQELSGVTSPQTRKYCQCVGESFTELNNQYPGLESLTVTNLYLRKRDFCAQTNLDFLHKQAIYRELVTLKIEPMIKLNLANTYRHYGKAMGEDGYFLQSFLECNTNIIGQICTRNNISLEANFHCVKQLMSPTKLEKFHNYCIEESKSLFSMVEEDEE